MCPTETVLGQGLATAGNTRCRDRTQCDAVTSFVLFCFVFFYYFSISGEWDQFLGAVLRH